jgi:hypothetical protein
MNEREREREKVRHIRNKVIRQEESVRSPTMTTFYDCMRMVRIEVHWLSPTTNCGNTTKRSIDKRETEQATGREKQTETQLSILPLQKTRSDFK